MGRSDHRAGHVRLHLRHPPAGFEPQPDPGDRKRAAAGPRHRRDHGRDRPGHRTGRVRWVALAFAQPGASNGWALGADRSTTGGGLLLANPHFPWEGELRFWENHLTIPGELNVYGVGLTGLPGVQIGFNDAVAWTHTVSAGHRFTLYRYDLDPTDPTTYIVDGEPQPMIASEYTIDVLGADGTTTTTLTRTLYSTHHGPVVDVAPLGWTADQAIAIRDGNIEITSVLEQYLGMDAATSMDEFQAVHERIRACRGSTRSRRAPTAGPGSPTPRPPRTSPPRRSPRGRPSWPPAG